MKRREDLEHKNVIKVIVLVDCRDGDEITKSTTFSYEDWLTPWVLGSLTPMEYVEALRYNIHKGKNWQKGCKDDIGEDHDFYMDLVPHNIMHYDNEVRVNEVTILWHDGEQKVYEL